MSGSGGLEQFTDENFEREVLGSERPVVVDFWSNTCAPCKLMAPVVRALAKALGGRARVGRLNVVENPVTTEALAIKGIPYMIVVRDGRIVAEMIGDRSLEDAFGRIEGFV
jgi:thioredoxin 1